MRCLALTILILAICPLTWAQDVITEYDEFQGITKIKTPKLFVYEDKDTGERIQFTFMLICSSKEKPDCANDVAIAIGALLKSDHFKFSSHVIALADRERIDLGSAAKLNEEDQDGMRFQSYALMIKRDVFLKLASAKSLKMQIGGVLSFTFNAEQQKSLKALSQKP